MNLSYSIIIKNLFYSYKKLLNLCNLIIITMTCFMSSQVYHVYIKSNDNNDLEIIVRDYKKDIF